MKMTSNQPEIGKVCLGKSGLYVSNLGVGTAGLSGLHSNCTDFEEAKMAIIHALNNGVTFIDTAPYYNDRLAERHLGEILKDYPRQKISISTKVGRYMNVLEQYETFDYSAERTLASVYESLECMNLSYIDVVFIHDVEYAPSLQVIMEETIPTLVSLKKLGLIRSIGVSGYSLRHLRHVVGQCYSDIDVIMSYFRHNLVDNSLLRDLDFYRQHNIGVINASPLAVGLLTNGGNVPAWNPAPEKVKSACRCAAKYCEANGVDLARLAIRYSVETPGIAMTLWSSRKVTNMLQNINYGRTPLSEKEEEIACEVKNKILKPVCGTHWEDKLKKYHQFFVIHEE